MRPGESQAPDLPVLEEPGSWPFRSPLRTRQLVAGGVGGGVFGEGEKLGGGGWASGLLLWEGKEWASID